MDGRLNSRILAMKLSCAADRDMRTAIDIASPLCKIVISESLYFLKQYELTNPDSPHYQSLTSIVHLAIDHKNESKKVAMKFICNKEFYDREIESRKQGKFNPLYVLTILNHMEIDEVSELQKWGLESYPYCIIMDQAERNLLEIVAKENLGLEIIRPIMKHVVSALKNMHMNGYIHGDLKPLHIMRIGQYVSPNFVLIDLDCSRPWRLADSVGQPHRDFSTKVSSAYMSPELINSNAFLATDNKVADESKHFEINDIELFTKIDADPNQDMWSLGGLNIF